MYVHWGTVYSSKDLEPNQMPINDRLDKENVAHIHHVILHCHKKEWVHVIYRDMDWSGDHHSQQTDTRTENQILHLTHGQMLNYENTWAQGGEHHTLESFGGAKGKTVGVVGRLGRDNISRNARYRWQRDGGSKPPCHVCTYATILHDLLRYPRTESTIKRKNKIKWKWKLDCAMLTW